MDAFVFRFTAKQLRSLPSQYLSFLIASGHCCNELAILLPYIIFEHNITESNEAETAFILTRKFTIDRILISKIVEYNELCEKTFTVWNASSDAVMMEISNNYQPIAQSVRAAKWARILRNKISFHYDQTHGLGALDRLDDDHPLKLIAGRIKGLTLFEFAEEIVARPIFEMAGKGDIGRGMDAANNFILDLVSSITTFHAKATISIFRAYGMMSERVPSEVREQYCAAPGELRVPISISSMYLGSFGEES
jgi:hypothetical protein